MTTLFDMTGERVLVSGGATGLGFAMAQALSRSGAEIVLLARREGLLEQAVSQLRAEGGSPQSANKHLLPFARQARYMR
jgi:NAD(P)-dependent dehydrogenase (short-subunit alcohol dehydrogenase family)